MIYYKNYLENLNKDVYSLSFLSLYKKTVVTKFLKIHLNQKSFLKNKKVNLYKKQSILKLINFYTVFKQSQKITNIKDIFFNLILLTHLKNLDFLNIFFKRLEKQIRKTNRLVLKKNYARLSKNKKVKINSKKLFFINKVLIKLLASRLKNKTKRTISFNIFLLFSKFIVQNKLYALFLNTKLLKTNHQVKMQKQFYNQIMLNGNSATCEKVFLKTIKILQKQSTKSHTGILKSAVTNVSPIFDIREIRPSKKKKKRKQNIKQYPFFLNNKNRISIVLKSFALNIKSELNENSSQNLANEIINSSRNSSITKNKLEAIQKQSILQKKFINFRWSPLN